MFYWFKRDNALQEALIRSYENQIGFLRSQLEYEQGKNDRLLDLIHTQAGLIKQTEVTHTPEDFVAIDSSARTWSQARKEIEDAYANPRTKEIQDYIADNESVIVGDYNPEDSKRPS